MRLLLAHAGFVGIPPPEAIDALDSLGMSRGTCARFTGVDLAQPAPPAGRPSPPLCLRRVAKAAVRSSSMNTKTRTHRTRLLARLWGRRQQHPVTLGAPGHRTVPSSAT